MMILQKGKKTTKLYKNRTNNQKRTKTRISARSADIFCTVWRDQFDHHDRNHDPHYTYS